ncbi:MAG: ATP-binding protein, partial [Prevotellaceae bacterium]|nr:ATP-binding protein [Candidatus Colivivens equi]
MQNDIQHNITKEQYAENVLAASMMSQTMTCCAERKYLDSLSKNESLIEIVGSDISQKLYKHISWLKLKQVGRPINETLPSCFGYIQKILLSCAVPDTQLTFLVIGNGKTNEIYLGLRNDGSENKPMSSSVSALNNFAKVCWPGLQFEQFNEENDALKQHFSTTYNSVKAITGIPTLADKGEALGTVEHLVGGLRGQKYAYLVTASPVSNDRLDLLLNQCREMGGQIESVKSINISQSVQEGSSVAHTEGHSKFESWSHSEGESHKDYKKGLGAAMLGAGVYMAAGLFFPPAMAILPGLEHAMGGALMSNNPLATFLGLSGISGMNVLSGFVPQRSSNDAHTTGKSKQISDTTTYSKSMTKGLSKTLVNKHAEAAANKLKTYEKRFETAKAIGAWNVNCLLFTEQANPSSSLQLKSILSGVDSTLEPIRIHDVSSIVEHRGTAKSPQLLVKFKNGPLFHHPFGDDFSSLQTLLTTKELAALVNFPLHSIPGVSVVDSAPEFSLTPQELPDTTIALDMGKMLYGGTSSEIPVKLPIDTLSRHSLVCGVNGSGKTNTVLSVLDGFMKTKKPFFVIEPAKTEYVDWAIEFNNKVKDPKKKIKIFIPGCDRYTKGNIVPEKLKLNPFEVINLPNSEMRVLSHIDRLKSIFASAFPMQDILPVILEHLLYTLYTDTHPMLDKGDRTNYMKKGFPTLTSINEKFIKEFMAEIGYAQENTQNISAALRTRFQSLKFGWKDELLNNSKLEDITWDELFGTPVIINLSYAGDDQDRAFIMSILLQFLYEYRIAEAESGKISFNSNECRHLVVVEEAHRIMSNCLNTESPQYKSGLMFSNFLSEVRAYGQGMMIVDQVPTRLIEDAIKNTNVKIVHKLVAADDSQRIAECIGLTNEQQKVISKLSIGQAVLAGFNSTNVGSSDSSDTYLAQINKMK